MHWCKVALPVADIKELLFISINGNFAIIAKDTLHWFLNLAFLLLIYANHVCRLHLLLASAVCSFHLTHCSMTSTSSTRISHHPLKRGVAGAPSSSQGGEGGMLRDDVWARVLTSCDLVWTFLKARGILVLLLGTGSPSDKDSQATYILKVYCSSWWERRVIIKYCERAEKDIQRGFCILLVNVRVITGRRWFIPFIAPRIWRKLILIYSN